MAERTPHGPHPRAAPTGGEPGGRSESELLTTREVAGLLRIKERKVYDLVAAGGIPHVRVTGKLLFPRPLLDAWLVQHSGHQEPARSPGTWPNIVAGSHDPLLDWALRESGSGLAAFFGGSLDGLERLAGAEAVAAGLHLPEPGAGEHGWNRTHVAEALAGRPVVLIEWARRAQGLIVAAGNPLGIDGAAALEGRRFIPRQREAGGFILFQELLKAAGLDLEALVLAGPPARTEVEVALTVADGKAEVGLGLEAMARQFRLDFVPLIHERFDLLIWRRAYFEPPLQRLFEFSRSERFRAHADELGGYDVSGFGTVHYNGP